MKHDFKIIIYLVILFFTAQVIGLFLLNQSIDTVQTSDDGTISVEYIEPITGRPELEGQDSFTYIVIMIFVGTAILLALIKFRLFKVWKAWYFIAVASSLSIALSVLINETLSIIISSILTYLKIYRPNAIIHNMTEIFIYAGIAILISPMFDVFWAVMLLVAISIYDVIAVWKSKHMVTLAKAQSDNKMFAGLLIPYKSPKLPNLKKINEKKIQSIPKPSKNSPKIKLDLPKGFSDKAAKSAILGGGDIAFPLMFSGAVMTHLVELGASPMMAYFKVLIIAVTSSIALWFLFVKSQKGKFYPAMPFISLGCFAGYFIIILI